MPAKCTRCGGRARVDSSKRAGDRQGTSLSSFAQSIYEDAIDRGVGMFLVDNVPTTGMTLLETINNDPQMAAIGAVQMSRHDDKPLLVDANSRSTCDLPNPLPAVMVTSSPKRMP